MAFDIGEVKQSYFSGITLLCTYKMVILVSKLSFTLRVKLFRCGKTRIGSIVSKGCSSTH